jgi:diacylglycerol kinase (ATP)
MTAKVILNPYAGRWSALQRKPEVEEALRVAGVEFELVQTEYPGHGITLAAAAAQAGFSPIISAGGDGSVSEVVNELTQATGSGRLPALGVLPLRSANDLVDNLRLPKDLTTAARVISAGRTRLMDLNQVRLPHEQKLRFSDNNAAIGLEPFITLIQQRMHSLRGVLRYLVATLKGVLANPSWTMYLEWDGGDYHGPSTLVTVGNCARTGGLFYMTPHADPFDGRLTFVYGFMATRLEILRLTLKAGAGSYIEHPSIHEVHATWLLARTDQPTPAHADGEIMSESAHVVEYQVCPARLPVLMP